MAAILKGIPVSFRFKFVWSIIKQLLREDLDVLETRRKHFDGQVSFLVFDAFE